jgi:hypothetical protein
VDVVSTDNPPRVDITERRRTFKRFVTGMFPVAAHAVAILLILDLAFR